MNQVELRARAMDLTLNHWEKNYLARYLSGFLKAAGGDIAVALELVKQDDWHDSMGNWGDYLRDVVVQCWGAAPRTNIEAWDMARGNWTDRKPDLVITWKEVLAFIKDGKMAAVQLELFQ